MPKMNLDEMAKMLFEEISVTIEGVEYTVGKVTAEMLQMNKMDKGVDETLAGSRQLAKVLGAKADAFDKTDLRVIGRAFAFIMEEITKQMGAGVKNSPTVEGTPSG